MFSFNEDFPEATNEQKWKQIKIWRNSELQKTDWTQLPDAPVDKSKWAIYRQDLRDLPAQGGSAEEAIFPTSPLEGKVE
jgi:hypothetical protein